ncbi:MAG: YlbF family regulator [Bacteroidales bacterium]|nr:YlbF family regulator [Clostridium sp.]MCM1202592.1 YlbF family regulator [Bacteroidales bacterium]
MIVKDAERLNHAIKKSEEYQQYQKAMVRVQENQELYQAMNAFRRRNHELQSYDDGVNRYQEIHNLGIEFESVLRNPVVNEFLVAEQIFSRKMAEVYETIADGLELDYSYME